MTCIVGIEEHGVAYIGGDSAGVSGLTVRSEKTPKVFRVDDFVFGYTSSFRMGQILQYQFKPPKRGRQPVEAYIVVCVIEEIRRCLKAHGYMKIKDTREETGEFLLAYLGHLFHVYEDNQATRSRDGLESCGCGCEYALGAAKATLCHDPKDKIKEALKTAAYFSGGVAPPFRVLTSES